MSSPFRGFRGFSIGLTGLLLAGCFIGCSESDNLIAVPGAPANNSAPPPVWTADMPVGDRMMFFDNFQNGVRSWEPMAGAWDVTQQGPSTQYTPAGRREFALSYAGNPNWSNYRVHAQVIIDDDRQGQVGIVGRGDSDHYYYELVLGRNPKGQKSWALRERKAHRWNTLATGAFEYELGAPYVLRLAFQGTKLEGSISRDLGGSFDKLGTVEAPFGGWQVGRFGVVTYGGAARFDDLGVVGNPVVIALADVANGWGQLTLLRDDTNTFPTGKPSGGWYVTPIHVNLRPDGKVLVTGFSRKAAAGCSGSTQRENGMTWLLDPASLALDPDGNPNTDATLMTTPINEQNLDPVHDVMYCAGHSTMADGRVFFAAGTRYTDPGGLPDSSPERGVRYSRLFDGTNIVRIANNSGTYHYTLGGQSGISYPDPGGVGDGGNVSGEKWYPTTLLMPDGKMLTFGGFHWSSASGAGVKANNSFEMFDTAAWDANHNTYPYSVLTQHTTSGISGDLPPTRGYSNMFLLPKPVPAGSAGGFARSVAIYGGVGRVALFNHEPGPVDTARLFAGTNALTISPDAPDPLDNERAEGGSGVLLSDGKIMIVNGGHTGDGAKRAYVYNPYTDTWLSPTGATCTTASCSLDTIVSRFYGQAVQLPDGKVMAINGYNGNPGGDGNPDPEPGNTSDVSNPIGDVRRPVLIDPYANPMTATGQVAWPEITHRGYHSVSLLLKDGRILVGGGKDGSHATGCEKNELRIYTPPYLQGNPTRPTITNVTEGQNVQVGGANWTINYTGTLKSTRGVALVAMGALTHAFDMGQRYVPLTVVSGGGATGSVVVRPPTNINIAQPTYYNLFIINSAGVPSVGKSIRLTPPPACEYNLNGSDQYIEAEGRSRGDGPFAQVADGSRSGGAYMQNTDMTGSHTTVPDEGKVLWYDLNVATTGNFYIWALANGPDANADTMWVSLDGNADQQLTLPTPVNTWAWVRLSATATNIPAGKHTLKIKVREDGALIDKLAFTTSSGFTPSGIANTPLTCGGASPPVAPNPPIVMPGDGQVAVSWNSVSGATSYTLKRGTAVGGPFANVPGAINIPGTSFTNTGLTNGTTYYYVVFATNAAGNSPDSGVSQPATPSAPPAGWTDADVGAVGMPGGTSTIAGGQYTVKGAGADIAGTADAFHFLYQTMTGNGSITARVVSIMGGDVGNTAKVGVMMRDPGADGLGANDVNAFTMIKPAATQNKFQRRLTSGGTTASTVAAIATPTWVRLTRTGNTILSEHSANGTTWTTIGSDTVTMTTVRVGLAVTSHTTTALTTAVFDNVSITGSGPPPAPTNLMCMPGNNQCQLGWTASAGATSYTVKRSTTMGSGYGTVQSGITGTSFTDNTVTNGTMYFYVVTASNGMESPNSNEAGCLPALPPAPNNPTNLVATGGNGQVSVTWTGSAGATFYTVKRSTTMGGGYTNLTPNPTATNFTDTTALNGTQYFYVVSASNTGGESGNSNEDDATPILPPPTGLVALAGNKQVALTWSAVTNATSYTVKRSTIPGGPYTPLPASVPSASFTDTDVVNGTTYYYVVAANGTMESANSNEDDATPSLPPPTGLAATPASNQVTLNWSAVTNATSYIVSRALSMAGTYTDLTPSPTATNFVDSTAVNGTTYWYKVRAVDATSQGPNSTPVSATPPGGTGAPTNLTATSSGSTTVSLTWMDNATTETGFRVERKVNAGSYSTLTTVGVNVQAASDMTATAGNTYTYRVIATGSPDSAPSNEVKVVFRNSEADAHVRDGQATANFGTAVALDVKTSFAAGATRHAYMRFSLTDVAATVTSAKLRVNANAVTSAKTIAIWAVSDITWGESTIIWNNKPAFGSQLATQSISTTAAFREFDIASYIQAQKTAGATKVTIGFSNVTQSDEGPTVVATKENTTVANRPLLLISSK
jgi:fibronectin type 3 domain-containing protein